MRKMIFLVVAAAFACQAFAQNDTSSRIHNRALRNTKLEKRRTRPAKKIDSVWGRKQDSNYSKPDTAHRIKRTRKVRVR